MTDNIQEFNNCFAYIMEGIVQDLRYFPPYYLILGIIFVFNIISLKWFATTERDSINLAKLSERVCAVESNCQNLLKSYDMSKDETLSLLNKLESSVRALGLDRRFRLLKRQ